MKNPPAPDPKPYSPSKPPDHRPTDNPPPIDIPGQGKLDAADDVFPHGDDGEE